MTVSSPIMNPSLMADYAARLAATDRAGTESVAQRLKQAASEAGGFAAGTTVTARYRYKVASDGSLVALQTQITADTADEISAIGEERGQRNRRTTREGAGQERAPAFRDYAPAKPQLSPSDEAIVFSALAQALPQRNVGGYVPTVQVQIDTRITPAMAEDESGTPLQADIIIPKTTSQTPEALRFSASFRQAQFSAASLYARSGEVVNQPTTAVRIAA